MHTDFIPLYVLDGHEPVPAHCGRCWGVWFEQCHAERVVGQTLVRGCIVSTEFYGFNEAGTDPPRRLFDTLVYGGSQHGRRVKTDTWEQAELAHEGMVAHVRARERFTWRHDWRACLTLRGFLIAMVSWCLLFYVAALAHGRWWWAGWDLCMFALNAVNFYRHERHQLAGKLMYGYG